MDIIKKIKDLTYERGYSIYRLSELSGIKHSTLANTFNRGTIPSLKNIEILCKTFGITLSQFFSTDETSTLMTKKELEMFENYKKLPEDIKDIVEEVIEKYLSLLKK